VVEVSTAGFLLYEASLLVQPAVKVSHRRFYRYDNESDDSEISICSSECGPKAATAQKAGLREASRAQGVMTQSRRALFFCTTSAVLFSEQTVFFSHNKSA